MAAAYAAIGDIATNTSFLTRVQYAMMTAAVNVAAEVATLVTNGTTASGNATLHFASVPGGVIAGQSIVDTTTAGLIPAATTVLSTTATTVVMSANATGTGVASGDTVTFTPPNHVKRIAYAQAIFAGTASMQQAAYAILTNATILSEASEAAANFGIPDADLQFSANSVFAALAGVG